MKIKRFLFCFILLSAFAVMFSSCQPKTEPKKSVSPLLGQQFVVGIKMKEYETKGKLSIGENGTLHFIHTNPKSVLFGMEEVIDDKGITVKYKGIEWPSEEVDTNFASIREVVKEMIENKPVHTEKCEMKGRRATKSVFDVFGAEISYFYEESDQIPLQIRGNVKGMDFEINFGVEDV